MGHEQDPNLSPRWCPRHLTEIKGLPVPLTPSLPPGWCPGPPRQNWGLPVPLTPSLSPDNALGPSPESGGCRFRSIFRMSSRVTPSSLNRPPCMI